MNDKMLQEYQERTAKHKVNTRKTKRKEAAKNRRDEPHHDGDRHVMISTVQ